MTDNLYVAAICAGYLWGDVRGAAYGALLVAAVRLAQQVWDALRGEP